MAKSHSLLELTRSIENVISRSFSNSYWIRAEISRLNFYPKSGHCYPELVEKQDGKIVAEIRSIIWSRTYQVISHKFKEQTGEELKQGMNILFLGQVKYSPTHGISINISDIDPSYTLGEIAKEKKLAIQSLIKEGVFNNNHNLSFPYLPQRLAIVSVSTSKGYHDFLETLKYKGDRFKIDITLFSAILQGDNAIKSINEQLINIKSQIDNFDLVLIIRGGGGDVGLHCYNNLSLARAVATFPIPVISGIGHSTNETVVEMVANTNKITPTAVADTIVELFIKEENNINYANQLLSNIIKSKIEPQKKRLLSNIRYLKSVSANPINQEKLILQKLRDSIRNLSNSVISGAHSNISMKIITKLDILSKSKINSESSKLTLLSSKLEILDPKQVLKRGFSLTMVNNKALKSIKNIKEGDQIKTILADGEFESEILKIKK